ncbi:DUF397 domain-containing protein [Streptomyces sp. NPDC012769]|uniref:DUF397 domain-containing protein n=1 Tax=Streptomyces sp. NPDC012769 TaxID=3364848 RepID=UPI0036C0D903
MNDLNWHKSSYSGGGGNDCVEVADNGPGVVFVRDTKDHAAGLLAVSPAAWTAFLESATRA